MPRRLVPCLAFLALACGSNNPSPVPARAGTQDAPPGAGSPEPGDTGGDPKAERAGKEHRKKRRARKKQAPWEGPGPRPPLRVRGKNKLLHEVRSDYSHMRVRQTANRRSLVFVQDGGTEWPQTVMNVEAPHDPAMAYQRTSFVSLLYHPRPRRALVVGLGGGSMVAILRHVAPETNVTAVEIDPAVVRVAADWFQVKPGPRVEIVTADAVDFIQNTKDRWDIIFMDVFLEPSAEGTDSSGVPRTTKTVEFLTAVRNHLTPGGVVVFNLHHKTDMARHLAAIEEAFTSVTLYRPAKTSHRIAVASPRPAIKPAVLRRRAAGLDGSAAAHLDLEGVLEEAL